jgi:hypothetical protein
MSSTEARCAALTDARRASLRRSGKASLWLTTSLSGALALALLAPGAASAAQACGAPVKGVVTCPVSSEDYPNGISYAVDPAAPQDLTINIGDGAKISSGASDGVYASNANGGVTISGSGVSISTTGSHAYGAFVKDVLGDVSVDLGSIKTSGDHAAGLVAYSSYATAKVSATDVTTSGDFSAGVFVGGGSGSTLDVDNVKTSGYASTGVSVVAGSYSTAGAATANVGNVETTGADSVGISVSSYGGAATVNAGSVITSGIYSNGIQVGAILAPAVANVDSVTTHGAHSNAIYGSGYGGPLQITAGQLTTTGDSSAGMRTWSTGDSTHLTITGGINTSGYFSQGVFSTSTGGDTVIDNHGKIVTTGGYSDGIISNVLNGRSIINAGTIETSGDMSAGIKVFAVGDDAKSITIAADSISTSGANANGITAENPDDGVIATGAGVFSTAAAASGDKDITITTGTVKVTGQYSVGIEAIGVGDVTIDAGDTSAANATAMTIMARNQATVTVHGATTSDQADAMLVTGADATLNIDKTGSVSGGVNGVVIGAVGPYVPDDGGGIFFLADAKGGTATINNAGVISGGSGYAIVAEAGSAVINNDGRIDGAVALTFNDDILSNSGAFNASKDSDFSDGEDRFINTGVLAILPGAKAAGGISFLNLEHFANNGGLVDLRNGHTGDVFTLSGDYVGSGDARLGLDIAANGADKLVVAGAATGKTSILLTSVEPSTASLTGAKAITLVHTGAGSAAGAFTIANPDIGFIRYGLRFDAAGFDYDLVGKAGQAAYRAVKFNDGANGVWRQSADAWSAHLADQRNAARGEEPAAGRVWGQFSGSAERSEDRRQVTDANGDAQVYNLDYTQTYYGVQAGVDLLQTDMGDGQASFGVTGGYTRSLLHFPGTTQSAKFDSVDLGGYAAVVKGAGFFNALAQYDHHWIDATDPSAGYDQSFGGDSYGFQAEAGARLGSQTFSFEPLAAVAYVRSDLDDLHALGQTLDFDKADGLRGKIGARLSSRQAVGGSEMLFYASAAAVHEFKGKAGLTLVSGGVSETIGDHPVGTYGQAAMGVDVVAVGGLTGFVEADGALGDDYKSAGGRIGLRFKF